MQYDSYHRVLGKEEELQLIIDGQKGCQKSLTKLVKHNIKLIYKTGLKCGLMKAFPDRVDDIMQNGQIGLLKAIEKFDINSGLKLSTYSVNWIHSTMQREFAKGEFNTLMVQPVHIHKHIMVLQALLRGGVNLNDSNVFELYSKEADRRNITYRANKSQITRALHHMNITAVSNDRKFDSGEGSEAQGIYESTAIDQLSPEEEVEQEQGVKQVNDILDNIGLKPRDLNILRLRFGLGTKATMTLDEIGKLHGCTRERIRQIQNTALSKLRGCMHLQGINSVRDVF